MTAPTDTHRLLLRAALLHGDAALEAWRIWRRGADLDRLDQDSTDLLPLLGRNLVRHAVSTPDLRFFRWCHRAVWTLNAQRFAQAAASLRRLQAAGLVPMLSGGAAVVLSAYADMGLRRVGRVTLLMEPGVTGRARGLLGSACALDVPDAAPLGLPPGLAQESLVRVSMGGVTVAAPSHLHQLLAACVRLASPGTAPDMRVVADAVILADRNAGGLPSLRVHAATLGLSSELDVALHQLGGWLGAPFLAPHHHDAASAANRSGA